MEYTELDLTKECPETAISEDNIVIRFQPLLLVLIDIILHNLFKFLDAVMCLVTLRTPIHVLKIFHINFTIFRIYVVDGLVNVSVEVTT